MRIDASSVGRFNVRLMSAQIPDHLCVSVRRHRIPALIATTSLALGVAACGTESKSSSHRVAPSHPAPAKPAPSPQELFARFQARAMQGLTADSITLAHKILDGLDDPGVEATNYLTGSIIRFGNIGTTESTRTATYIGYDHHTRQLEISSLADNSSGDAKPPYTSIDLLFQLGPNNPLQHKFSGFTTESFRRALGNPADVQLIAANGEINDLLTRRTANRALGIALHKGTLYSIAGLGSTEMVGSDPTQIGATLLTTQTAVRAAVSHVKKILGRATAQLGAQLAG
jgi:hypothetical protein